MDNLARTQAQLEFQREFVRSFRYHAERIQNHPNQPVQPQAQEVQQPREDIHDDASLWIATLTHVIDFLAVFMFVFMMLRTFKKLVSVITFSSDVYADIYNYANIPNDILLANNINFADGYAALGSRKPLITEKCLKYVLVRLFPRFKNAKKAFFTYKNLKRVITVEGDLVKYHVLNSLLLKFSNNLLDWWPRLFTEHPALLRTITIAIYCVYNFALLEYFIMAFFFFTVQLVLLFGNKLYALRKFFVRVLELSSGVF